MYRVENKHTKGDTPMTFMDLNDCTVFNLHDLKHDYIDLDFSAEGLTFWEYLAQIIDATLRGRNDLEILDMTEREAGRLMAAIVRKL